MAEAGEGVAGLQGDFRGFIGDREACHSVITRTDREMSMTRQDLCIYTYTDLVARQY